MKYIKMNSKITNELHFIKIKIFFKMYNWLICTLNNVDITGQIYSILLIFSVKCINYIEICKLFFLFETEIMKNIFRLRY